MGETVCRAVEGAEDMALVGRADPLLQTALADVLGDADVVVDFSTPDSALANARTCLEAGVHCVMGTSGRRLLVAGRAWGRPTCSWRPTSRSARC